MSEPNLTFIGSHKIILNPATTTHKPSSSSVVGLKLSDFSNRPRQPVALKEGIPKVTFQKSDKTQLMAGLKHILIAKFSHGRPSLAALKSFFANRKLRGSYHVSIFDANHVFVEFQSYEDFAQFWIKQKLFIQDYPVRFFKWDENFEPSKESALLPVWIHLPGLPLYLFQEGALLLIANALGRPLFIDGNNLNRSKVGYATMCIELDILSTPVKEVWIQFGEETCEGGPVVMCEGFLQKIKYDFIPPFCSSCSHLGHTSLTCKRGKMLNGGDSHVKLKKDIVLDKGYLIKESLLQGGSSQSMIVDRSSVPIDLIHTRLRTGLQELGLKGAASLDSGIKREGNQNNSATLEEGEFIPVVAGGMHTAGESGAGYVIAVAVNAEEQAINSRQNAAESFAEQAVEVGQEFAGEEHETETVTRKNNAGADVKAAGQFAAVEMNAMLENTGVPGENTEQAAAGNAPKVTAAEFRGNARRCLTGDTGLDEAGMAVSISAGSAVFKDTARVSAALNDAMEELVQTGKEGEIVAGHLHQTELFHASHSRPVSAAGKSDFAGQNSAGMDLDVVDLVEQLHQAGDFDAGADGAAMESAPGENKLTPTSVAVLVEEEEQVATVAEFQEAKASGNVVTTRPENETIMQQLRRINREAKAKKSAEKKAKKSEQKAKKSALKLLRKQTDTGLDAGLIPDSSFEINVTPRKLSSAAVEFTPKCATVLVDIGAGRNTVQTDMLAGERKSAGYNDSWAVLVEEEEQESEEFTADALTLLQERLHRLRGDNTARNPGILSDGMGDIPRPFKIKSAPNSPKGRNSSYDSSTYLLSRGLF